MKDLKNIYVHPSSYCDDNVKIGEGTKIWHFSHIQSGAEIGRNCSVGQNVNIANNVIIGNWCSEFRAPMKETAISFYLNLAYF